MSEQESIEVQGVRFTAEEVKRVEIERKEGGKIKVEVEEPKQKMGFSQ